MKPLLILTLGALLGVTAFVFMGADPSDQTKTLAGLNDELRAQVLKDVDYIVTQKHRADIAAKVKMSQEVGANIRADIENLGGTIIDPDRFTEEFFGNDMKDYLHTIKEHHRSAYLALFTPDEITALANFYRSEDGQTLLGGDPKAPEYAELYTLYETGPGAPFLARKDALFEIVKKPIQDQTARLEQLFSTSRMAEFIERSDLIHFEDESRRKAIVDAMRGQN